MRTFTLTICALTLLSLTLLAGCAATAVRDLVATGGAGKPQTLGKTILIAKVDLPPENAGRMEKNDAISELARQALASLPGVEVMAADALTSRLPERDLDGASDAELAAAALDAGAQSVVLVHMLGYSGELTVPLPPAYWTVTLEYAYHARVIDARTGALYLDAHRGQHSRALFGVRGKDELAKQFKANFAALLSLPSGLSPAREGSGS